MKKFDEKKQTQNLFLCTMYLVHNHGDKDQTICWSCNDKYLLERALLFLIQATAVCAVDFPVTEHFSFNE
jgi:hypothetical protein